MQDNNYVAPLLCVDSVTGLPVPVKCTALGYVLVTQATDGSEDLPSVPPIKYQDENYVPVSQGVDDSGEVAPINASYSGILKVKSV